MKTLMIKDYMLIKRQMLFVIAFCIIVTPVLSSRMNDTGLIGNYLLFFLFDIILLITIPGTISIAESRDKRAVSFLCMMPIRRKRIVTEKYLMDYILVLGYAVIYIIESGVGAVPRLKISLCAMLTFVALLYRAIYIPLEFKFGYDRTKFITTFVGLLLPFGLPALFKNVKASNKLIESFDSYSIRCCIICVAILIGVCSYILARRIFSGKDM